MMIDIAVLSLCTVRTTKYRDELCGNQSSQGRRYIYTNTQVHIDILKFCQLEKFQRAPVCLRADICKFDKIKYIGG